MFDLVSCRQATTLFGPGYRPHEREKFVRVNGGPHGPRTARGVREADKTELAGPAVPEPGYDSHADPTADWDFGIDVNGVVRHYAAMRSKA